MCSSRFGKRRSFPGFRGAYPMQEQRLRSRTRFNVRAFEFIYVTSLLVSFANADCPMQWYPGMSVPGTGYSWHQQPVLAAVEWDRDGEGPEPTSLVISGQ